MKLDLHVLFDSYEEFQDFSRKINMPLVIRKIKEPKPLQEKITAISTPPYHSKRKNLLRNNWPFARIRNVEKSLSRNAFLSSIAQLNAICTSIGAKGQRIKMAKLN